MEKAKYNDFRRLSQGKQNREDMELKVNANRKKEKNKDRGELRTLISILRRTNNSIEKVKDIILRKTSDSQHNREFKEFRAEGSRKMERGDSRIAFVSKYNHDEIEFKTAADKKMEKLKDRGDVRKTNIIMEKVKNNVDLLKLNNCKQTRDGMDLKVVSNRRVEIVKEREDVRKNNKSIEKVTIREDQTKIINNRRNHEQMKSTAEADKKSEGVEDSGDLTRINNSKLNRRVIDLKDFMPDRVVSKQYTNQSKTNEMKKLIEAPKKCEPKKDLLRKEESSIPNRTYLDLEGKKQLRERYTLKLKKQNMNKISDIKVETKENERNEKKANDEVTSKDKSNESSKDSVQTEMKSEKKSVKEAPKIKRKPIIKTVTLKNDNRVYKAVTFVDQKQHKSLLINIPNDYKRQKVKEVKLKLSKTKIKPSKESMKKIKVINKTRRRGKKPRVFSPEFYLKGNASPPTEVAKWAPSCINHHTKPYYEAWVDTTLAAISKCSKKDQLHLEKQNLIRTFKRALRDRPETPDLVYENIHDERYTGKIKIRQR